MSTKYNDHLINKELEILRNAIDKADEKNLKKIINSPEIKKIFKIVENFIQDKNLICYGGTAINNILPEYDQFYNKNTQIPDYDFFSMNALDDAKKLADIYYKSGFQDVEAKSGIHFGTYKVYVNFIPVADITQIEKEIFKNLKKNAIIINNIHYAPSNYLKMASYLELSRPAGDISRWEKVLKRLMLLNKHYPTIGNNCFTIFKKNNEIDKKLSEIIKNIIINEKLIFFGGYALQEYSHYLSNTEKKILINNPIFDILSNNPKKSTNNIIDKLKSFNITNINFEKCDNIGEIIPMHYIIKKDNKPILFIYQTIACHSYNKIKSNNKFINVATIDTILSFYLAFLFSNKDYHNSDRLLCIAEYLFKVQVRNKFKQKGVLKRFTIKCYGNQDTLINIRAKKAKKFKELKSKKNSKEYQKYFLRYIPDNNKNKKTIKNKKS